MHATLAKSIAAAHPQMLRADLRTEAKPDRKKLADLRPEIGKLVARALELAGVSKQDAAHRMDYSDAGTVSRWCSGTERPAFDKLFQIQGFEIAYVCAIAERNQAIEVTTVITIPRRPVDQQTAVVPTAGRTTA